MLFIIISRGKYKGNEAEIGFLGAEEENDANINSWEENLEKLLQQF